MGYKAIEFITTGKFGVMTAISERTIVPFPIEDLVGKHRSVSPEYIDISNILSR